MTVTTGYLYKQLHTAVVTDTGVYNQMSMFYTPNIKVYRGIDNYVRIEFKNRDQKRVAMTDHTAKIVIMDKENSVVYVERALTVIDARRGLFEASITEGDLLNLDAKSHNYSLKVTEPEGRTTPAYADDNYGANGTLEVVEGVYPAFKESPGRRLPEEIQVVQYPLLLTLIVILHNILLRFILAVRSQAHWQYKVQLIQVIVFKTQTLQLYQLQHIQTQTDNAYINFTGVYSAVPFCSVQQFRYIEPSII